MIVFSVGDYIRVRNVCMRTQQAAPNIGHVHAYVHASQEDAKVTYNAQTLYKYMYFLCSLVDGVNCMGSKDGAVSGMRSWFRFDGSGGVCSKRVGLPVTPREATVYRYQGIESRLG